MYGEESTVVHFAQSEQQHVLPRTHNLWNIIFPVKKYDFSEGLS